MDGAVSAVDNCCGCIICNRRIGAEYGKTKTCGVVAAELQEFIPVADLATPGCFTAFNPRREAVARPGVASPILSPNHCGLGNPGIGIPVRDGQVCIVNVANTPDAGEFDIPITAGYIGGLAVQAQRSITQSPVGAGRGLKTPLRMSRAVRPKDLRCVSRNTIVDDKVVRVASILVIEAFGPQAPVAHLDEPVSTLNCVCIDCKCDARKRNPSGCLATTFPCNFAVRGYVKATEAACGTSGVYAEDELFGRPTLQGQGRTIPPPSTSIIDPTRYRAKAALNSVGGRCIGPPALHPILDHGYVCSLGSLDCKCDARKRNPSGLGTFNPCNFAVRGYVNASLCCALGYYAEHENLGRPTLQGQVRKVPPLSIILDDQTRYRAKAVLHSVGGRCIGGIPNIMIDPTVDQGYVCSL